MRARACLRACVHCSAVEARGSELLELELQVRVKPRDVVLGTEFGSSARAAASPQSVLGFLMLCSRVCQ